MASLAPDPRWVTTRRYPENVIAETVRDLLWALSPEFCDAHPTVHRDVAAEAMDRLSLHISLPPGPQHLHNWALAGGAARPGEELQLWRCQDCGRYDAIPVEAGEPSRG